MSVYVPLLLPSSMPTTFEYSGYIGIMEKKNGNDYTLGVILGLYLDSDKENGNYYRGYYGCYIGVI